MTLPLRLFSFNIQPKTDRFFQILMGIFISYAVTAYIFMIILTVKIIINRNSVTVADQVHTKFIKNHLL